MDAKDRQHHEPRLFLPFPNRSSLLVSSHLEHDSDCQCVHLTERRVLLRFLPSVISAVGSPTDCMVLNPLCLWCHSKAASISFKGARTGVWRLCSCEWVYLYQADLPLSGWRSIWNDCVSRERKEMLRRFGRVTWTDVCLGRRSDKEMCLSGVEVGFNVMPERRKWCQIA